jgi:hypothetical protein
MKYVIAIIIAFFSLSASAGNDYCDSRPGQTRTSCYQLAIDGLYRSVTKFTGEVKASKVIDDNKKKEMLDFYGGWMDKIGRQCRTQVCEYDSVKSLGMDLRVQMYKLKIVK